VSGEALRVWDQLMHAGFVLVIDELREPALGMKGGAASNRLHVAGAFQRSRTACCTISLTLICLIELVRMLWLLRSMKVACAERLPPAAPSGQRRAPSVPGWSCGSTAGIRPCAFWPDERVEPPVRIGDRGPSNVLMAQNERDPGTPPKSCGGRSGSGPRW
jgi:hypothetical protein